MAYEPLHHKYRPQTFAQLTGQEAIAQTLTNALNSDKIAPAYLFSGPRGTGKTSSARILAKSLNCLNSDSPTPTPCGKCEVCVSITNGSALDVIEIDAASNTGVDNIREIIERSQFAPVKCRYKVYVIDECHMLSTAAFNALLKTLEEPPPRVIFVLATTDPQRVLPTIISRCQRFDYRRIPLDAMVKHLREIAEKESIAIDDEALSLVAQLSNGGMRDAQSLLDQLSLLSGTITSERVWDLVGAVSEQDLLALLEAIASDQTDTVISQCRKLLDRGREPLIVLQNLANFYLNLLIAKTSPQSKELVAVTEATWQKLCQIATNWQLNVILQGQKKLKESEFQIKNTTQPRLWLEITLLNLLPSANQTVTQINSQTTTTLVTKPPVKETESKINSPLSSPVESKPSQSSKVVENQTKSAEISANQLNQVNNTAELKELIIQHCQKNTTKAFFRECCHIASFDGDSARIAVKNDIFFNMANAAKKDIELAFHRLVNHPVTVVIEIDSQLKSSLSTSSSSIDNTEDTENNNYTNKVSEKSNSPNNSVSVKANQKNIDNQSTIKDKNPVKSSPSAKQKKEEQKAIEETKIPDSHSNSGSKITKNAADNLAKNLNGEIILIESKIISPRMQTIQTPKIIINRTEIPQFDDDDDIPF